MRNQPKAACWEQLLERYGPRLQRRPTACRIRRPGCLRAGSGRGLNPYGRMGADFVPGQVIAPGTPPSGPDARGPPTRSPMRLMPSGDGLAHGLLPRLTSRA